MQSFGDISSEDGQQPVALSLNLCHRDLQTAFCMYISKLI